MRRAWAPWIMGLALLAGCATPGPGEKPSVPSAMSTTAGSMAMECAVNVMFGYPC
jgi:hypothetical protein